MKLIWPIFSLLCLVAFPSFATGNEGKLQASKTFSADEIANIQKLTVDLKGTSGGITLNLYDEPDMKVEVYGSSIYWKQELSDEVLAERFEQYDIAMNSRDDKEFTIKVNHSEGGYKESLNISLVIYLPRTLDTWLSTSGGSVEFNNYLGGSHTVKTSGGALKLNRFEGDMEAETNGGQVNVLRADGKLSLKTSGGNAWMAGLNATLDLETSGGSINADFSAFGEYVTIDTNGGSCQVELPLDQAIDLEVMGKEIIVLDRSGKEVKAGNNLTKSYGGGGVPVSIDATYGGPGSGGIVQVIDDSIK
jgi:DUF4097 and DUF4098 domain-containing protein YvlB